MADRSNGDQNQRENGTEEGLEKYSQPINHQKRNEERIDRLLATVSHKFKQITKTATEELEKKNGDLCKRLIELERERERYRNETDKLRIQVHEKNKLLTEEGVELRATNYKLQQTLAKLNYTEKELDEAKSSYFKLKEAYDEKITQSDPNVAELSDNYRPTKLAEKYAELYDNQWTDAYEEVERYYTTDEHTTQVLLEILMDVMRFCEQRAKRQMEMLQAEFKCSDDQTVDSVPVSVTNQLKNLRKELAIAAKDNVYQLYVSTLKRSTDENHRHAMKIEPFVKECFEVCWFMLIQDPPLVFCPLAKRGESLDTNLYKIYTRLGKYIEFMVWPAMLLHESGPILAKGIAQGTNEKKDHHAVVEDKTASEYFATNNTDSNDHGRLARTKVEENYPYGQSQNVSYTRDNRYLSSDKDRHHQRSKSAEATRPTFKQSTVVTTGLGTKQNAIFRRLKYERHPTSEEMRRFFYFIDRRDYSGAQNALGYDIYRMCLLYEHKRKTRVDQVEP